MDLESSYEIFDAAIKQALNTIYYDPNLYDDLYQECYMKILQVLKYNTYEPIYNLHGYAYKIARNAISTYLYHQKKLVTLSTDEFPEIASNEEFEVNLLLDSAADYVLQQYSNIIPKGFTKEDLIKLLNIEDPTNLVLVVLKGELIWRISKPMSMEQK